METELLDPGLDEMEPILGDSFSFDQMIAALRATNYQVNAAIEWLMNGTRGHAGWCGPCVDLISW